MLVVLRYRRGATTLPALLRYRHYYATGITLLLAILRYRPVLLRYQCYRFTESTRFLGETFRKVFSVMFLLFLHKFFKSLLPKQL